MQHGYFALVIVKLAADMILPLSNHRVANYCPMHLYWRVLSCVGLLTFAIVILRMDK